MPSPDASDRVHVRLPKSVLADLKVCATECGRPVTDYVVAAACGALRGSVVLAPEGPDTTGAAVVSGQNGADTTDTESLSLPPGLALLGEGVLRRVILGAVAQHLTAAAKRAAELRPLRHELAQLHAGLGPRAAVEDAEEEEG